MMLTRLRRLCITGIACYAGLVVAAENKRNMMVPYPYNANNAVLDYNLGVTKYKEGDYQTARDTFGRIDPSSPVAAYAYYNIALSHLRQKNNEAALEWLSRSKSVSTDHEFASLLTELMTDIDGETGNDGKNRRNRTASWRDFVNPRSYQFNASVSASVGYRSDERLDAKIASLRTSDTPTNLATRFYLTSAKNRFEFYSMANTSSAQSNSPPTSYGANWQLTNRFYTVENNVFLGYENVTFPQDALLTRYSTGATLRTSPFGVFQTFALVRYQKADSNDATLSPQLGNETSVQLGETVRIGKQLWSLTYQIDDTNKNGIRYQGQNLLSLSFKRFTYNVSHLWQIGDRFDLQNSVSFARVYYKQAEQVKGMGRIVRDDELFNYDATLGYAFSKHWRTTLSYSFYQDRPNIIKYWTQNRVGSLGLTWTY